MTATGHALIGAIIAAKISNPVIGIPLAIASHIAADSVPHWDTGTHGKQKGKRRVLAESVIDVAAGFILSYVLLSLFFPSVNLSYAFIMILASQGFDWAMAPYYFFNVKLPPFTWAYRFQKKFDNRLDKPWGIINQVVAIAGLLLIALIV